MPEDTNCKLLQPPRSSEKKKKKKKKRKKGSSPPENTEKPQPLSLPLETMAVSRLPLQSPGQPQGQLPRIRASSKKDGERLAGSGRRSRKHPKDSSALQTATSKSTGGGAPAQGDVAELGSRAGGSLRWEGVLEDPQAEEERLELYRANRRQRYISHREALEKRQPGCAETDLS